MLEAELEKFDPALLERPRWLVFTKADLLPAEEGRERAGQAVAALGWTAPWRLISSATGSGTGELMKSVSAELDRLAEEELDADAAAGGDRPTDTGDATG
jgi:GTP-binding protein